MDDRPTTYYIAPGSFLRFTLISIIGGTVTVYLQYRLMDGRMLPARTQLIAGGTPQVPLLQTQDMFLPECYLDSLMVAYTDASVEREPLGSYVQIQHCIGNPTSFVPVRTLITDGVSKGYNPSFPQVLQRDSIPFSDQVFISPNHGAGAEMSFSVGDYSRFQLLSLRTNFQADANVANRTPTLVVDEGLGVVNRWRLASATVTAAGAAMQYAWINGIVRDATIDANEQLPNDVYCLPPQRIRTATVNLQAGDAYGDAALTTLYTLIY